MLLSSLASVVFIIFSHTTAAVNLTVASTGGNVSSPLQYGLMFEDINHSGDGGIYAELIQNRAFQGSTTFPSTVFPWESVNGAVLSLENLTTPLSTALPTSLNVAFGKNSSGTIGILNPGWFGIDVQPQTYTGSFFVLGQYTGDFTASLQSVLTNETFASVKIPAVEASTGQWAQYNFTLEPATAAPNSNNSLVISFEPSGVTGSSLSFNLISLFPPTYKGRANGMRIELMEALKALNPSFLRMPGGNNLEGNASPDFWQWNQTIGPLVDRPGYPGTWGYTNTMGLGLAEYLFWCEDLEIEPILAVWSGLFLDQTVIAEDALAPYVQDALDELEFIMGDASTELGALRISLGLPEAGWTINFVEVGNEDNLNGGAASYTAYRFSAFYDAITAAYPNITVMASTIATQDGVSAGDYHDYSRPDDYVNNFDFFDNANAELNHKTLIGEYACIQGNSPTETGADFSLPQNPWPTWIGSVGEAIFTLGAERNTDKIIGASYAPGFQNLNSYQWAPDMISFTADPSQTVLSTSYHVIELLSNSRFSEVLPTTSDSAFSPAFWVAGVTSEGAGLLKAAVYNTTSDVPFSISFDNPATAAQLVVLTAPSPFSNNSIGVDFVTTDTSTVEADDGVFSFSLPEYSVAVLTTQ